MPDEVEINRLFEHLRTPEVGTVRAFRNTRMDRTREYWWEFLGAFTDSKRRRYVRYANDTAVVDYEARHGNIVRYRFVAGGTNHRYF